MKLCPVRHQWQDVFVSESFDLTTARKLQFLLFGAQQASGQKWRGILSLLYPAPRSVPTSISREVSCSSWRRCGMMKAALPHHLY